MQKNHPGDFEMDRIWCGPGKGAALQIRHLPTGLSVRRNIGYDPDERHLAELMAELKQKIQAHGNSGR
jgi:hypothetical protein